MLARGRWFGLRRISWEERRRMLRREAWIAVALAYAILAAACAAPDDLSQEGNSAVAVAWIACLIRVFTAHLGLLLLAIGVVAAAVRHWRLVLACFPLAAVGAWPVVASVLPRRPPAVSGRPLKIFSTNLLMVNRDTEPAIREIRDEDPDVIAFQEYTEHWHRALRGALGGAYPHEVHVAQEDSFGAAIYSKRPLARTELYAQTAPMVFPEWGEIDVPALRADIEHEGRTITLYNIHLLPMRNVAYAKVHRRQFRDLLELLGREKNPVLLTGDFNFNQFTSSHRRLLKAGFEEGHAQAGGWTGNTWPVIGFLRRLPGLRLDHLYLGPGLACVEHRRGRVLSSDHRAVIGVVGFRRRSTYRRIRIS